MTIASVVEEFRMALPEATVFVYDNNSTDDTVSRAIDAGAVVRHERLQGKGYVMRRMFADIDADVYVVVDGDATYEAASVRGMVDRLVTDRLDLVNGRRMSSAAKAYRPGHQFGNWFLSFVVARIFGNRLDDMLSGLKVLSRRFVKSFPALTTGFEIETELTVHALELVMPVDEVPVNYRERVPGSHSKLNTIGDGLRIGWLILNLIRAERPALFFGGLFLLLAGLSSVLGFQIVTEWQATGLVRVPTAVLATGLMIVAFVSAACGLILQTVTLGRRELKRLAYLRIPPVSGEAVPASRTLEAFANLSRSR
jgi:glycosyltransferase involved in cell wall biosynthesis